MQKQIVHKVTPQIYKQTESKYLRTIFILFYQELKQIRFSVKIKFTSSYAWKIFFDIRNVIITSNNHW